MDLALAIITEHAASHMAKRMITEADVREALSRPEVVFPVRDGRVVAQATLGDYMLRAFVDVDR